MLPSAPLRSVSEVTSAVKQTLESTIGEVRVRGEISNFKRAASGHLYFSLKDDRAQLRSAMFRGSAIGLRFLPADGLEVEAEGEITVYEPRGDLQLIVRRMLPSGLGALMQAFEALKRRLAGEGLFDPARKRPLPEFPRTVAIITSPTGAAVRDLLHVLGRRWPIARLVFLPVQVQGKDAARQIAGAIDRVDRWGEADVVIVGRGGGSLEDLWAFNEEPVARAIAACRTPVISAVGHETDTTIADFVADLRAATPSAAAELAVPDHRELRGALAGTRDRLERVMRAGLVSQRHRLQQLEQAYGFRRPEEFLRREVQRLDHLSFRLRTAGGARLADPRRRLDRFRERVAGHHPRNRLETARRSLLDSRGRLRRLGVVALRDRRSRLDGVSRALRALDPTAVLDRGYALVRSEDRGTLLTAAGQAAPGDGVVIQFRRDRLRARVQRIEPGAPLTADAQENS